MFSLKSRLQRITKSKPIYKISRRKLQDILKMGSEIPNSNEDWDYPLTDEDLRAIDSAVSAAASAPPPVKRRCLPESLFAFQKHRNPSSSFSQCSSRRFYRTRNSASTSADLSAFREVKFGGRIIYSRTVEEVERAAEELLNFVETKKRKEGQCILGLDIEWRPSFRTGVAQGKAAVMQICGENNCCHVMHIIHSGIPKRLQCLLEDPNSVKVGVAVAGDASKVFRDFNISVTSLEDLCVLANRKLGGYKIWSLSTLTETLIFRQLPKPNKIRLGNWEVEVLSKEQLYYAATDAYISWYLYQVLKNLPDPPDEKNEETVEVCA